jgi:hypothetical protein
VSHHDHAVASLGEKRSLEEALGDLSDPRVPSICASLYAMQLELYLREFPAERILVIDQAELGSERRQVLRRAFSFLEVDPTFDSPRFDDEFLKTSDRRRDPPRFARFVELTLTPWLRRLPPSARLFLRRSVERTLLPELESTDLGPDTKRRLQGYYAGEVDRLRELTGMKFATWSI